MPESKTWPAYILLALSWSHANRLYNLFAGEHSPDDWLIELFGRGSRSVTSEMFDLGQAVWNDICHLRRINRATLILTGLASALEKSNEKTIEKLKLKEFVHGLAFNPVNGQNYPVHELILDISLANNSMCAYIGMDRTELGSLLGNDEAEQFTAPKLAGLTQKTLLDLEREPTQYNLWSVLYAIFSDLPVDESLVPYLKSVIERMDFTALKDQDSLNIRTALFAYACRMPSLGDNTLRLKVQEKFIRLAEIKAVEDSEDQDVKMPSEYIFSDIKVLMFESACAISVVQGNPEDSCKNFAELMNRLAIIWPAFGRWLQPVVFRLVTELPVRQSKKLWNLLLTIRAC